MIRNKHGLERDIYCALEHFGDRQKALEYILNAFGNDYTETDIRATFEDVRKRWEVIQ